MASFDLSGRIALVTGGGTGIGLGIARALAACGARVILAGRREAVVKESADQLNAAGGQAEAIGLDVARRPRSARRSRIVQARHGRLDILVNSAGTNRRKPTLEYDEASWDIVVDTNLKGAFFCSQAAALLMKTHGYGRIINIGSLAAQFAQPMQSGYASSKAGMHQLTQGHGHRAGAVRDHGQRDRARALPDAAERAPVQRPRLDPPEISRIPMGRGGDVKDLGGVAVFLSSPASEYVTGQVISVDGGLSTGN